MVNLFMSFIIALVATLAPWSAFAGTPLDMGRTDELIKKYSTSYERPKSCPMESRKFSDLIAKAEALKDVLKGNCLKKDSDKMNEVLDSIKGIQTELQNQSLITASTTGGSVTSVLGEVLAGATTSGTAATGAATTTTTTTTDQKTLDGLKYSKVFSNITTMFKKNQCSMEDGRVLEMTADLIYDSTQIGVLAGNKLGLIVAGGGFLISSSLRLIDLIIKKRFDFDKSTDRQSFVKLNCSFYEIRRELDVQGAFDIENSTTRDDYRDVKAIVEQLTNELKAVEEEKVNTGKSHFEIDKATFIANVGDVSELKKVLSRVQRYLQPGVNLSSDIPSETQKMLMISQLAQDYDTLVAQLRYYKTLNISSIPMLDDVFLSDLEKFDSLNPATFMASMNMSASDFNNNHRAKLLFHMMRIDGDLNKKGQTLSEKSQLAKNELSLSLDKKKELYIAKLIELKKIENRLGNLVAPKQYTGFDDGSENMVAILENHKNISGQLYGEWGEKFLKYTTYKSLDEANELNKRLGFFNTKYASFIDGKMSALNYLCQDAQKLRVLFKHSDSLVQEGFDFVATNKDIIYSDVKNSYNGTINEEKSFFGAGPVEKVQRHYKSAIFALAVLRGELISDENRSRYLEKNDFGMDFIGKAMLEVSSARNKIKMVQDVYDRVGCQKSLASDLE
jgi:hypothetical protein